MGYELTTEQDVKNFLGIKDFRNVTKDDVVELTTNLFRMDPAVALKCIDQFPDFAKNAGVMVQELGSTANNALEKASEENSLIIQAYSIQLSNLNKQLTKKMLTSKDKDRIANLIVDTGNKLLEAQRIAAEERSKQVGIIGRVVLGVSALFASVIGGVALYKNGKLKPPSPSDFL